MAANVRWVVKDGDGATVGEIALRAGGGERAVEDGRVFVGRRRATHAGEPVRVGDEVTVASRTSSSGGDVRVLLDRDDIVAVVKVAGIPTIPDHAGTEHSLLAQTARTLGVAPSDLHATSRLDRDVSGVVVFARSKRAAERLARARAEGVYVRRYVALAMASSSTLRDDDSKGTWNLPIGRAKDARHRAVNGKDAVDARTRYAVIARATGPGGAAQSASLLALAPETGRTHQIRVHSAHAGAPLLGDRTYGGPTQITLATGRVVALARICLHCARVTIPMARAHVRATLDAPVPEDLAAVWTALGGDAASWADAIAATI